MKTKRRYKRKRGNTRKNNTKYGKKGGFFGFNLFGEKVEPESSLSDPLISQDVELNKKLESELLNKIVKKDKQNQNIFTSSSEYLDSFKHSQDKRNLERLNLLRSKGNVSLIEKDTADIFGNQATQCEIYDEYVKSAPSPEYHKKLDLKMASDKEKFKDFVNNCGVKTTLELKFLSFFEKARSILSPGYFYNDSPEEIGKKLCLLYSNYLKNSEDNDPNVSDNFFVFLEKNKDKLPNTTTNQKKTKAGIIQSLKLLRINCGNNLTGGRKTKKNKKRRTRRY